MRCIMPENPKKLSRKEREREFRDEDYWVPFCPDPKDSFWVKCFMVVAAHMAALEGEPDV